MNLKKFQSHEAIIREIKDLVETTKTADLRELCSIYLDDEFTNALAGNDPFTTTYRNSCVELYKHISGRNDYMPAENELANYADPTALLGQPSPYNFTDSVVVGDFISSWGWIFRNLNVKGGQSVLEYGPGEGQIALNLARIGCDVSVIDIEDRYLQGISVQAEALRVRVRTKVGVFGDGFDGETFDRIFFFEAFHHALDHVAVMRRLKSMLKPGGFVLFAGEPIVRSETAESAFVPFPWGPRLDGLSVWSSYLHGWCELGFQEAYFVDMLMRSGWMVQKSNCPVTGRGTCYMAHPRPAAMEVGDSFLISTYFSQDGGWHDPQGDHRWTNGRGLFPLAEEDASATVTVSLTNHLPLARIVTLGAGSEIASAIFEPGRTGSLELRIPPGSTHLEILCDHARADDPESADKRQLGIAVHRISIAPS